uniref:Uncharacterized protein n=1 Tax=Sinocyclocheilus anshuiensis TaxID=1608454 RepID=A0A671RJT1_9TELE
MNTDLQTGVASQCFQLIFIHINSTGQLRRRVIPVRHFSQYSDCSRASVSLAHLKGLSLEESLAAAEDLNKRSDEELKRRKAQLFERNRKHKEDPDFTCSWDEGPSDEEF